VYFVYFGITFALISRFFEFQHGRCWDGQYALLHLGPVAPISVNFNHQLTQHHRHDNSNSRATSANSRSVKWVSQLS